MKSKAGGGFDKGLGVAIGRPFSMAIRALPVMPASEAQSFFLLAFFFEAAKAGLGTASAQPRRLRASANPSCCEVGLREH